MSLHHFKYIGKRQIAANAASNVGKPRTVKAMTLAHNTVTRENLVENDSGKVYQVLLEANMATEVGLIALDCLGLFCIHFKVIIITLL